MTADTLPAWADPLELFQSKFRQARERTILRNTPFMRRSFK